MNGSPPQAPKVCPTPWQLFIENGNRWSAAARHLLRREGGLEAASRVISCATPPDLPRLLAACHPVVVAVEAPRQEFSQSLDFLARIRGVEMVCPVALVSRHEHGVRAAEVTAAALEAGALVAFLSPREMSGFLRFSIRFADVAWRRQSRFEPTQQLIRKRLPWQPPPWEIG